MAGTTRSGHVRVVAGRKGEPMVVRITTDTGTADYLLRETDDGYQLDKQDGSFSEPYIVAYDLRWCSCPDYRRRRELCKHCKALTALWQRALIN